MTIGGRALPQTCEAPQSENGLGSPGAAALATGYLVWMRVPASVERVAAAAESGWTATAVPAGTGLTRYVVLTAPHATDLTLTAVGPAGTVVARATVPAPPPGRVTDP